jgi:seryl-tRNA synthetase
LLDIKWIRDNPGAFVKGLADRGSPEPRETLNRILSLDEQRRATIQKLQEAQARRNAASKEIGQAKAAKDEASAKRLMDEVAGLKAAIQQGEADEKRLDDELKKELESIPNTPAADVPVGDESANKELRKVGTPRDFKDFKPKQHFELGEALGLMDFETAAKLSGSRFVVLKGALARLERALSQFMLDLHTSSYKNEDGKELGGYTEVNPPLLVRDDTMFGTAQLPKFVDDQFRTGRTGIVDDLLLLLKPAIDQIFAEQEPITRESKIRIVDADEMRKRLAEKLGSWTEALSDERGIPRTDYFQELSEEAAKRYLDLWLIPTAEVPLTNLVRDDITDEAKLPLRVTAGTPCFRAEAGAAGKDTRGMIRQHQFSKVELVSITTPEQSREEHERMTKCAEEVLKRLGIPYRVIVLSTGDMGFASQKTYDIEVWLPGQGAYREISSCSNCGDFQARRMNARYRPQGAKDTRFVHTLNGSGVAVGRALIAVMENYQDADGSIRIPDALLPYMGGLTRIEAAK